MQTMIRAIGRFLLRPSSSPFILFFPFVRSSKVYQKYLIPDSVVMEHVLNKISSGSGRDNDTSSKFLIHCN